MWQRLAPILRKAGHEVLTPSLTGIGERAHLASPAVDLHAHIADVLGTVRYERVTDAVLVGHSYGGMVVTGAADRKADRIKRLVYLDAFVPANGKCLLDYAVPERAARMRHEGERTGFVTPPPMSLWGHVRPDPFVAAREVKHPFATMAQKIRFRDPQALARIPKTFVYCAAPATGSFDQFAAKVRNDPAWRFHELRTGHDAMLLVPDEVARILLGT